MYGLIIVAAVLLPTLLAEKHVKDTTALWGLVLWAIVGGLVGARLYHVIDFWQYYSPNPLQILFIWQGGLGILGALVGGFAAAILYLKSKKQRLGYWLNLIAVFLPLGQSIGRWANYFNQELYGLPTTLPWGIFIAPERRAAGFSTYEYFHPLFLYESILCLALFTYLYISYKNNVIKNTLALYLIGYGLIRFLLEFFRINPWQTAGFNVAQVVAVAMIVIGFYAYTLAIHAKFDNIKS